MKNRRRSRQLGLAMPATCGTGVQALEDRRLLSVSAQEQFFVYRLNRARHDPQAYAGEAGLGNILSSQPVRPPLAVNNKLFDAAEFKSLEMANNDYFSHTSAVTGVSPNKLVRDFGYELQSNWDDNANFVESLAGGHIYSTAAQAMDALIIDEGVVGLGHRKHLLSTPNDFDKEIGIGYAKNSSATYESYWTVHITRSHPDDRFLTGVTFNDANNNNRYDLNEGIGGVQVKAGDKQTTSNAHGGWSIKVDPGTYNVTASGGGYTGTSFVRATVGEGNVEVDFESGLATGYLDFDLFTQTPSFSVTESDGSTSVSETGSTDAFEVALTARPQSNVVLNISSGDTTEATVSPNTVTFTPSNWDQPQAVTVTGIDDVLVDGSQTTSITVSVNDAASNNEFDNLADQVITVTTTDDDVASQAPGNVDGSINFDANDSFLIHLVQLAGTNDQIAQSLGTSQLTPQAIRTAVTNLGTAGDVDGSGTFNGNDSFLIHLVLLAGTDDQIDQSKGASTLTATEIRSRITSLGTAPRRSRLSSRTTSPTLPPLDKDELFAAADQPGGSPATIEAAAPYEDSAVDFADEAFRNWIDIL